MMPLLVQIVATGAVVRLAPGPEPPAWEDWVARYRPSGYPDDAEVHRRRLTYAAEAAGVRAHNARAAAGLETYTQAVNEWSDLTTDEWAATVGLRPEGLTSLAQREEQGALNFTWLPSPNDTSSLALDWRAKGAVTEVKNQGGCGACWSFGATGTMEGAWFLAGHKLVSLSEEQLIHCSGQSCSGGNPGHAIEYVVKNHGIDSERDYRYTAKNGKCDSTKAGQHVAAMRSAASVPQRNERQLLAAVMRQPVAVAIDAVHGGFRSYHRGVMGGKCGEKIDHSVLIVGFGVELVPPAPPPGPTVNCAKPERFIGCFDINGTSILPKPARRDHDKLTLENCALQCDEINLTVAGIDAGNHCNCGTEEDTKIATARSLNRPLSECQTTNCTGNMQEQCGGRERMLAYLFNCTISPPPPRPTPPPPPRELPYWIVKNSWGSGYGDHGYIRMQRGVGKAGLCCINCMPQYAVSIKGPPPTPAPPPPPRLHCNVSKTLPMHCFNTSGLHGLILPGMRLAGRDSDRVSLESCAAACSFEWTNYTGKKWAGDYTNDTLGGVQLASPGAKHKSATDRCACGAAACLETAEARARVRPLDECLRVRTNCTGNKNEPCGGLDRILAYRFKCSPAPLA